jgi:hypothetical protein
VSAIASLDYGQVGLLDVVRSAERDDVVTTMVLERAVASVFASVAVSLVVTILGELLVIRAASEIAKRRAD